MSKSLTLPISTTNNINELYDLCEKYNKRKRSHFLFPVDPNKKQGVKELTKQLPQNKSRIPTPITNKFVNKKMQACWNHPYFEALCSLRYSKELAAVHYLAETRGGRGDLQAFFLDITDPSTGHRLIRWLTATETQLYDYTDNLTNKDQKITFLARLNNAKNTYNNDYYPQMKQLYDPNKVKATSSTNTLSLTYEDEQL